MVADAEEADRAGDDRARRTTPKATTLEIEITVEAVRQHVPATVVKTPFFNPVAKRQRHHSDEDSSMIARRIAPGSLRSLLMIALLLVAATSAHGADASPAVRAQVGQAGKDVVWVPTPQALVDKMLDMAKVTPQDYMIDLGSGDGRTVITAAKRGATAHGIEYNPDMVELSQRNAAKPPA